MYRIGNGYDAHRLTDGRALILGGVCVPYPKGLLGHSDADVLTHAVMDALLGATGLGDIGKHFPDDDEQFRGISSLTLLERTAALLSERNASVINVDCVVVAQQPKLAPYLDIMRANIAVRVHVDPRWVNIKATTEEGMGFTGSGEGISAYAVCLLEVLQPVSAS